MPKHSIFSINNRLRCGHFQSYNFWEYLTGYDSANVPPLYKREDKNGRTLAGCGVWRTAQREISAAAGYCGEKRFKIQMDEKHTAFVVLKLQMFHRPFPAFVWSVEVRSVYGAVYTKHNILAVDRKKWRDINETDAKRVLFAEMMPPGYWLNYQVLTATPKKQIVADRLAGKYPFVDRRDCSAQIRKSCRRNSEYMHRRETANIQKMLNFLTLSSL